MQIFHFMLSIKVLDLTVSESVLSNISQYQDSLIIDVYVIIGTLKMEATLL